MRRILTLFLLLVLTIGLTSSYLFLSDKITTGRQKIVAGEKQLKEGEEMLAKGKAKLARGKQQLSQAKSGYSSVKKPSYLLAAGLPVAGAVLALAGDKVIGNKISQGDQMVAEGSRKVKNGEEQLEAGKLELQRGIRHLKMANRIRIACGIGALFFACLLVRLGYCWRGTLVKIVKFSS